MVANYNLRWDKTKNFLQAVAMMWVVLFGRNCSGWRGLLNWRNFSKWPEYRRKFFPKWLEYRRKFSIVAGKWFLFFFCGIFRFIST